MVNYAVDPQVITPLVPAGTEIDFENGHDESLATIKGRFWYVQLKKRF
jgi:hypothetical protein